MLGHLNFVTAGPDNEVRFVLDNGWSGTRQRPFEVELENWREQADSLRLDDAGFVLDRVVSGVTDYSDQQQLKDLWEPAVKQMVLRATGGSQAYLFAGPLARFSERRKEAFSSAVSAPARAVHSDLHSSFTFDQLPLQPVAEAAVEALQARFGNAQPARWRIFNVWQVLSPPPQDTGLALCKLSSVAGEDVVDGKGYFASPDLCAEDVLADETAAHQFDLSFFRHNPHQQWGYFADMLPGEALIFSAFDPKADARKARVPHGALDIPHVPAHAVPRNSIEIRALVVFDG